MLDERLIKIFPFVLLRDAYVDARYKKSYAITETELTWLAERISELQQLTEILCQEKINSFISLK